MTVLLPSPRVREEEPAVADGATSGALRDAYGRVATDLRVSLIDKCNLRCTYCMPAEGLEWLPKDELLTDEEIVRLVRIGVTRLGITTVRLTGGEPLLRPRPGGPCRADRRVWSPGPQVALTTNGIGLARRAAGWPEPGSAASTCRWTLSTPTSSAGSVAATGWLTYWRAFAPPRGRDSIRSNSTPS